MALAVDPGPVRADRLSDRRAAALRLAAAVVTAGAIAVLGQVLLIREFLAVFGGNELAAGLVLASWLLWTGLGSLMARGRQRRRRRGSRAAVVLLLEGAGLALPAVVLAVRGARAILGVEGGEEVGLPVVALAALIVPAPFCVLTGALFTAAIRLWQRAMRVRSGSGAGAVYALETLGAMLGGLVFTFVLVGRVSATATAGLVALAAALAAALVAGPARRPVRIWANLLLAGALAASLGGFFDRLDERSAGWPFRGLQLLAVRETPYGELAVTRSGTQISLHAGGALAASAPDRLAAEMRAGLAAAQAPELARVLLLGGLLDGTLDALLALEPGQVDAVEIDPAVIELGERFFAAAGARSLRAPGVNLVIDDPRRFVRAAAGRQYDLVLIDLPPPTTAALNRFYTADFFAELSAVMAPRGVVALELPSDEVYLGPGVARLAGTVWRTLAAVFPRTALLGGAPARCYASPAGELTENPALLAARLAARRPAFEALVPELVPILVTPERTAALRQAVGSDYPANRDLAPRCYLAGLGLWVARHLPDGAPALERLASLAGSRRLPWLLAAAGLAPLAYPAVSRRRTGTAAVAVAGFAGLAFEILLLIVFQTLHGLLFGRLALLVAAIMGGMALGSGGANEGLRRGLPAPGLLAGGLAGLGGLMLLFLAPLAGLPEALLVAGGALAGVAGGVAFPAAVALAGGLDDAAVRGGSAYGADLAGSAAGALLVSTLLLPLTGIRTIALALMVLCLSTSLAVLRRRRSPAQGETDVPLPS